jgi:hypothetical protein
MNRELNEISTRKYISEGFRMGQLEEIKGIGETAGREDRKRRTINKIIVISLKAFNALCIPVAMLSFMFLLSSVDYITEPLNQFISGIFVDEKSFINMFLFNMIFIGYFIVCIIGFFFSVKFLFSLSDLIKASLNYYDKTGRFYKRNKGKEVVRSSFCFLLKSIFLPRERKNQYREGGLVK